MPTRLKQLLKRIENGALIFMVWVRPALWAFFNIAGEVGEGETAALDKRILLALHAQPRGPQRPHRFAVAAGGDARRVTAQGRHGDGHGDRGGDPYRRS